MKAATINELKKELVELPENRLVELCLHLSKYKKENKELLSYLLFESGNKKAFILSIKNEIDELYAAINIKLNFYLTRKSIRKILRLVNKYSKYMDDKESELELLLYFVNKLRTSGIRYEKSAALNNVYEAQKKKIRTLIATLHEDLQYDYLKEAEKL